MEVRLSELGRRNHGVLLAEDARRNGVNKHQLSRLLATGFLRRPLPRVYVLTAVDSNWRQELAAAQAWAGSGAAFSHRTAAGLWHLRGFESTKPIEMTTGRYLRTPSEHIVVHRVSDWLPGDLCQMEGLTVTTPSRTVIDLAGTVPAETLRDVVDEVLLRELSNLRRLRRRLEKSGRSGRAGAGRLFKLIEEFDGSDLLPRSVLERRYLSTSLREGLPPSDIQHPVTIEGQRYLIDFAYPESLLAIEMDGWRFHGGREAWEADIRRSNALVGARWQVIRGTWRGLQRDPLTLIKRVKDLLMPPLGGP